jgi:hypothetical protein
MVWVGAALTDSLRTIALYTDHTYLYIRGYFTAEQAYSKTMFSALVVS